MRTLLARPEPVLTRKGMRLQCDICGNPRPAGQIRPFSQIANVFTGDKRVTMSFGSLDVCKVCWEQKAMPRRRASAQNLNPFTEV